MVELRLAGLDCRLCGGTDGNGAGSGPLVVLLHGFGAPGTDLVDLAEVIRAPLGTRYLFPAGPIDLSVDGSYPGDARAWWPIDLVAVQVASLLFVRDLNPTRATSSWGGSRRVPFSVSKP